MFEALLTLCAPMAPEYCRDALLPGFEASAPKECLRHVLGSPIDWGQPRGDSMPRGLPRCAAVRAPLAFDEIGPGIYVHRGRIDEANTDNSGDVANIGFVVGGEAVAIIDAGGSRAVGEGVYRAVRTVTDLPIRYLVLTHVHPDHVLGASVFLEAGARVVGHRDLKTALLALGPIWLRNFGRDIGPEGFAGTDIALPDISVTETSRIELGGRVLELQAWPLAHSAADLTVHDPTSGVLFAGDLVFAMHAPALDGSVIGWRRVLDALKTIPATRLVPGHGGPVLPWPEGADALSRYLSQLESDTRAAIADGHPLAEAMTTIAASERSRWQLFELFNPRNASRAYTELEWE